MICSNKINPDRFKICRGYLCLLRSNYVFMDRQGRRSLQGKIKLPYENHPFGCPFYIKDYNISQIQRDAEFWRALRIPRVLP